MGRKSLPKNEILALIFPSASWEEGGPEPTPRMENALPLVPLGPLGPGEDFPRDAEGALTCLQKTILRDPHEPTWGRRPEIGQGGGTRNNPTPGGNPAKRFTGRRE